MIVDTNALSAFFDGEVGVIERFQQAKNVYLPVIVLGEYRYGLLGSREKKQRGTKLLEFSKACEVLPVLNSTAIVYSEIKQQLKLRGTPIPENDIWIASIAMEKNQPVLSDDHHFDYVQGLNRIAW